MIYFLKKIKNRRWLICCLLFFTTSCKNKNATIQHATFVNDSLNEEKLASEAMDSIYYYKNFVKTGDLILRTGKDFTSETFRRISKDDKTFSHCGIASIEHDSLFIYHSIGGEFNPNQKIRRDAFEFFCNPYENRGFGIFRYKLTKQQNENLIDTIQSFYNKGVMFDMQFDLATDDKMYCTEFVYKAVIKATHHAIIIPVRSVNHIQFVAPDNLYHNHFCEEIKRIKYPSK